MTFEETLTEIGRGVKTAVSAACDVARRLWEGIRSRVKNLVGSLRRLFEPEVEETVDEGECQRREAVVEAVRRVLGDVPLQVLSAASDDERRGIVETLVEEISSTLHIAPPAVAFRLTEAGVAGSYSCERHCLTISLVELRRRPMDVDDAAELLDTVVHELYHAFQHQATQDPARCGVSPKQAEEWLDNFYHYTSASQDLQEYYAQPVERTAWAFAHSIVREFWTA